MSDDLIRPYADKDYVAGWNPYCENDPDTGIDFGIHILEDGMFETFVSDTQEIAVLIVKGKGEIKLNDQEEAFDRKCWMDQSPWAAHAPKGTPIEVYANGRTEIAVIKTENAESFPAKIYTPDDVENEHRGKDMLDDASYRIVRCVFDRRWAPENAKLVLGEVVNFPGRWSSYPPHHHTQPELYYYRMEPEWGYGHGELGETVYKIRHKDLLKITDERDHAQTSAPGFHMYYLWTIRHLPGEPYDGFTFTEPFGDLVK